MKDQSNNNDTLPKVVVVIVPLPLQGHLNQLLHLSHLITSYGVQVHYAGSSTHNHQARVRLLGWDPQSLNNIHFHDFQLQPYESPLPLTDRSVPFPTHFEPLLEAATHLREPVSHLLHELSTKFTRVIVIHDNSMAYVVQDVKHISNAEAYCFIPICAFTYFSMVWEGLPQEAKPFELDSKDDFNGIPSQEGCATQSMVEFMIKQIKFLGFESGYIYNTSREFDGRYVEYLEKLSETNSQMKHFVLGPFHPVNNVSKVVESVEKRNPCLQWLDEQEKGSVIYVSFGSTTSLPNDQIEELANGLETCGEKFMWVVRGADPNDVFIEGDKVEMPRLPKGYEERVKGRGMVVKKWAPQVEILGHSAIGGFMSHCGWNSCMESISMGVSILAWPMHSDQPKNAFFVAEVLRVGVSVRDWERRGEVVSSSVIENAVRTLMKTEDGKEIRKRAGKLGEAVKRSVAQGGVCCLERNSFIEHISR